MNFNKFLKYVVHPNTFVIAFIMVFIGIVFAFVALNNQFNPEEILSGVYGTGNQQLADLEALKIKEVAPGKYAFKSLDGNVIEIGTEKRSDSQSQPYVKLNKWDGEVSLKVNVPYGENGQKSLTENKLTWANHKYDVDFYPKEPEEITEEIAGEFHTFKQNEQGGVEFDVILKEKPESNIFEFPIETQGLKFYYQPELTQEEIDEGAFRPENVVGSYAVYHETQDKFFKTKTEAEKYKAGIAFHIYRPKVYDAAGNEIWGELNIDEQKGTLTIIIDQKFLDEAVYPVVVDPIFGFDTKGGTVDYCYSNIRGSTFTITENGVITSISAYSEKGGAGGGYLKGIGALYDTSGNLISNTTCAEYTSANPPDPLGDFRTSTVSSGATLSNGTAYAILWHHNGVWTGGPPMYADTYYNSGDADQGISVTRAYDSTMPSTLSFTTSARKYSIYATYTVSLGGSCTEDSDCTSGNCQFNVCCESGCTGDCHCWAGQVAASGDDGGVTSLGFSNTNSSHSIGCSANFGFGYGHIFALWTGVTIEGTITTSYIELYEQTGASGSPEMKVYGVDEDNPAAPISEAEFNADPLTIAAIDWDDAFTVNTWERSLSLNSIFQELVDTYTISNEAVMVQVKNDKTCPAFSMHSNSSRSYDYSGNLHGPKLYIEYTPAAAGENTRTYEGLKLEGVKIE